MRTYIFISFLFSVTLLACGNDSSSTETETNEMMDCGTQAECTDITAATMAGDMAGSTAGTIAGETAGSMAGSTAGMMAGDMAGDMAGSTSGTMAGEMAGSTAGAMAGDMAGSTAGAIAGDMAGSSAGMMAGDMADNMSTDYMPNTPLNQLSEDAQLAFCEANIERGENNMLAEADLDIYIVNLCKLAGILGTESSMECETSITTCEMDLRTIMFSTEQCLRDREDQFSTCSATVSDIEVCEDAIRDQVYAKILNFNFDMLLGGEYDCSSSENSIEKALLGAEAQTLLIYPNECSVTAQSCIELE